MKWLQLYVAGLGLLLASAGVQAAKDDGRFEAMAVPTENRVGLHVFVPQAKVANLDAKSVSVQRDVLGGKLVAVGTAQLQPGGGGGLLAAWQEDGEWYPDDPCQYTVTLRNGAGEPIGEAVSVSYAPGRMQRIAATAQSIEPQQTRLAWKVDPADIRNVENFQVIRTSGTGTAAGLPKLLPATARVHTGDASDGADGLRTVVYAIVRQQPGSAVRWLSDPDAPPVPMGLKAQWYRERVSDERYQAGIRLSWDRKATSDRRTATYCLLSDGGTAKHLDRPTDVAAISGNEVAWKIDNVGDLTYRVGIVAVGQDGRRSRPAIVEVFAPGWRVPAVEIATSQYDEALKSVTIKWAYQSPSHLAGFRIRTADGKVIADPKQVQADARRLVWHDAGGSGAEGLAITAVSKYGMESVATPLKGLSPIPASEARATDVKQGGVPELQGSTPALMERLAQRVANGEADALGEMEKAIDALNEDPALKQDGERRGARTYGLAMAAVNRLAAEATKGKGAAFDGLKELLTRKGHLASYVPDGLGRMAADGNDEALQMLLDAEANGMIHSSAVAAMGLPAAKQNPQAIRFLAGVLGDPDMKAMWNMAATGLEEPARKGNAEALRALERYRANGGK